jgi:hypothetical protein
MGTARAIDKGAAPFKVFKRALESFQIIIRRPLDIGTDARRPNVLRTAPPRPDEVRLEQTAIGVNFSDVYCRTGYFDLVPPGGVPGIEGTGIVSDIGAGVAVMFAEYRTSGGRTSLERGPGTTGDAKRTGRCDSRSWHSEDT